VNEKEKRASELERKRRKSKRIIKRVNEKEQMNDRERRKRK
jgi:hypothetical protein